MTDNLKSLLRKIDGLNEEDTISLNHYLSKKIKSIRNHELESEFADLQSEWFDVLEPLQTIISTTCQCNVSVYYNTEKQDYEVEILSYETNLNTIKRKKEVRALCKQIQSSIRSFRDSSIKPFAKKYSLDADAILDSSVNPEDLCW